MREKALEVYKKLYNEDMKVEVIHAGLECGAISQNYPDIDFISVGPNLRDVHTPSEYLEIDSTERVYNYVVELINSLRVVSIELHFIAIRCSFFYYIFNNLSS